MGRILINWPGCLWRQKKRLGVEGLTGLADGGYYESTGLKECEEEGITVYGSGS